MTTVENQNTCAGNCPCMERCPLEAVMDSIGGKWKLRILCALHQDGKTRYNTLKRKIGGITNTMLAASLRELELNGLVSRTQYAEMPVRVEYELTEACGALIPILGQIVQWGMKAGLK